MDNPKLDPKDCLDIILTDNQLHTLKIRKPNSFGRQYVKAVKGGKEKRAYSNSIKYDAKTKKITFSMDLGMEHLFNLAKKHDKKYVRFLVKKNGLPVALGKDVIEKLQADYKKYSKK